jgi:hypothetical protein
MAYANIIAARFLKVKRLSSRAQVGISVHAEITHGLDPLDRCLLI